MNIKKTIKRLFLKQDTETWLSQIEMKTVRGGEGEVVVPDDEMERRRRFAVD